MLPILSPILSPDPSPALPLGTILRMARRQFCLACVVSEQAHRCGLFS